MSDESAFVRRIVPLCRKKTSAHELAFAVLNSGVDDPHSATVEFESKKTGEIYQFTCDDPKRVEDIIVVIAKKIDKKGYEEDGGVGTITVTINSSETTRGKGGLGEPLP